MATNYEELVRSLIEERFSDGMKRVRDELEDTGINIFDMEKVEALIKKKIEKDFEKERFSPYDWEGRILDVVDKEDIPNVWAKVIVFNYMIEVIFSQAGKIIKELNEQAEQTMVKWFNNVYDIDDESYSIDPKKLCYMPLSTEIIAIAKLINQAKKFLKLKEDEQQLRLNQEKKKEKKKSQFAIDCLSVCLDPPYRELLADILDKFDFTTANEVISDSFVENSQHKGFFDFILVSLRMYDQLSEQQKKAFKKIVDSTQQD